MRYLVYEDGTDKIILKKGIHYFTEQEEQKCVEKCFRIVDDVDFYVNLTPLPTPTFEELKQQKIVTLKAQRDKLEVEPITVEGNTFDYDEKARERINNAIIALQASGTSIHWTLADNTSVEVTAEDLIKVVSAVAIRSNALHVAYRVAKEKVLKTETKEELNGIVLEEETDA